MITYTVQATTAKGKTWDKTVNSQEKAQALAEQWAAKYAGVKVDVYQEERSFRSVQVLGRVGGADSNERTRHCQRVTIARAAGITQCANKEAFLDYVEENPALVCYGNDLSDLKDNHIIQAVYAQWIDNNSK